MSSQKMDKTIEILLVEDSAGDIRLTREAFKDGKVRNKLHVVRDGVEAMVFLHKEGKYSDVPRPDIILLDLNLPKKNGREVLTEIKKDPNLKRIPVVILTMSNSDKDILETYNNYVNCYITKPVDFTKFITIVQTIEDFWLSIVKLPNGTE
ncbi:response regulator [Candidatus Bathyarchaeota archaeon RBG_13_38_9]|nr:MAG: response regulator [Candidatus Bathyarchaeota archaeon RBG_13_38_9]